MSKYVSLRSKEYTTIFRCKHEKETTKEVYKKVLKFGIWRLHKIHTCDKCDNKRDEPMGVFKYDRRDKKTHKLNIIKSDD